MLSHLHVYINNSHIYTKLCILHLQWNELKFTKKKLATMFSFVSNSNFSANFRLYRILHSIFHISIIKWNSIEAYRCNSTIFIHHDIHWIIANLIEHSFNIYIQSHFSWGLCIFSPYIVIVDMIFHVINDQIIAIWSFGTFHTNESGKQMFVNAFSTGRIMFCFCYARSEWYSET